MVFFFRKGIFYSCEHVSYYKVFYNKIKNKKILQSHIFYIGNKDTPARFAYQLLVTISPPKNTLYTDFYQRESWNSIPVVSLKYSFKFLLLLLPKQLEINHHCCIENELCTIKHNLFILLPSLNSKKK